MRKYADLYHIPSNSTISDDLQCTLSLITIITSIYSPELCLTSNIKGQTVATYEDHHFKDWHKNNHPIIICVSLLVFKVLQFNWLKIPAYLEEMLVPNYYLIINI